MTLSEAKLKARVEEKYLYRRGHKYDGSGRRVVFDPSKDVQPYHARQSDWALCDPPKRSEA